MKSITTTGLLLIVSLAFSQYIDMSRPEEDFSSAEALLLESLPGAPNVVYINWSTIGSSPEAIATLVKGWRLSAEDFRPFNVNITTNVSIFNNTPVSNRLQVDLHVGDGGGACALSGFGKGSVLCWAPLVNLSHEIGHGLGLNHDGGGGDGEYYKGNEYWGPLMGFTSLTKMSTFSKGEYSSPSNTEDDLYMMDTLLAYRVDDHGSTLFTGTPLIIIGDSVSAEDNNGLIERNNDIDIFRLVFTEESNVELEITPLRHYNNLHVKARILDENGIEVVTSTPFQHDGNISLVKQAAIISADFSAGNYYLEISNSGYADSNGVGYSSYASLGYYEISGYAGVIKPRTDFELAQNTCLNNDVTIINNSIGTNNSYTWTFEGANIASSIAESPMVFFDTEGVHQVSLSIVNSAGSSIEEKWIEVGSQEFDLIVTSNELVESVEVTFINKTSASNAWSITHDDFEILDNSHMVASACLNQDCYDIAVSSMFSAPDCGLASWRNSLSYLQGDAVSHLGHHYVAKYWTNSEPYPGETTWTYIGQCSSESDTTYFSISEAGLPANEYLLVAYKDFSNNTDHEELNLCLTNPTSHSEPIVDISEPNLYPNPVTDELQFNNPIDAYFIKDINGILITAQQGSNGSPRLNSLNPGVYFVYYQLKGQETLHVKRIMKL